MVRITLFLWRKHGAMYLLYMFVNPALRLLVLSNLWIYYLREYNRGFDSTIWNKPLNIRAFPTLSVCFQSLSSKLVTFALSILHKLGSHRRVFFNLINPWILLPVIRQGCNYDKLPFPWLVFVVPMNEFELFVAICFWKFFLWGVLPYIAMFFFNSYWGYVFEIFTQCVL